MPETDAVLAAGVFAVEVGVSGDCLVGVDVEKVDREVRFFGMSEQASVSLEVAALESDIDGGVANVLGNAGGGQRPGGFAEAEFRREVANEIDSAGGTDFCNGACCGAALRVDQDFFVDADVLDPPGERAGVGSESRFFGDRVFRGQDDPLVAFGEGRGVDGVFDLEVAAFVDAVAEQEVARAVNVQGLAVFRPAQFEQLQVDVAGDPDTAVQARDGGEVKAGGCPDAVLRAVCFWCGEPGIGAGACGRGFGFDQARVGFVSMQRVLGMTQWPCEQTARPARLAARFGGEGYVEQEYEMTEPAGGPGEVKRSGATVREASEKVSVKCVEIGRCACCLVFFGALAR